MVAVFYLQLRISQYGDRYEKIYINYSDFINYNDSFNCGEF